VGLIDDLESGPVALDTQIFIYFIEEDGRYLPLIKPLFEAIDGVQTWTSDGPGGYMLTVSDPRGVAPAVVRALVSAGADVVSVSETHHSLEDVYLELVGSSGGGE